MKEYLTIAELAELADIPNSTCRRYLANFEQFFVVKGGSRLKKYEVEAVDILKRIKDLYDEGLDTGEIHNILADEFAMIITVDEDKKLDKGNAPALATSEQIAGLKQEIQNMTKTIYIELNKHIDNKLQEQREFFEQKFEEQQRHYEEKLKAELHDRQLIKVMKENLDKSKQETASTLEETSKQMNTILNVIKENIDKNKEETVSTVEETSQKVQDIQDQVNLVVEELSQSKNISSEEIAKEVIKMLESKEEKKKKKKFFGLF